MKLTLDDIKRITAGALEITEDDATDAKLQAFAAKVGLDVAHLAKVKGDKALAEAILALADTNYAFSAAVINYRLENEVLDFYALNKLSSFSARLGNSYASSNDAGIRATFAVNEDLFLALFGKYGKDKVITFGTRVIAETGNVTTLSFIAKKTDDGVAYYAADGVTPMQAKVVDGILTYTWTITYRDDQLTEEYLNREFSYERFVEIEGVKACSITVESSTFGESVSLAEIYEAAAEKNPDDAIVAKVLAKINPPAAE